MAIERHLCNVSFHLHFNLTSVMEDPLMKISGSSRKLPTASVLMLSLCMILSAGIVFASEEGGGGGGGLTVIPDWTTLVQMANFLILIWVLNLILYRPIRNVLLQRKDKVVGLEQSIEAASKDVLDKEAAYAAKIKEARAKGLEEKEKLMGEAAEEESKLIAEINEKAQAELAKIREKVGQETEDARKSLMQEIDSFAEAIGQKILGRAIS